MTGVLLNAGAQLLLKAGTNELGVITLTRDGWPDTLVRMATAGPFHRSAPPATRVAVRLDPRPLARAGVGRLSAAVGRLHRQRDRRALSVRRSGHRRRAGSASASSSSASGWSRGADNGSDERAPYLKFAGPVLDEATIAGVGDVLRSGQITSGPWVRRFEARAVGVLRRPAGARADLGDRGGRGRAAALRHRPGRRGDHLARRASSPSST